MYQLFTKRFDSNNAVHRPAAFELIRRTYFSEVSRILEYYKSRVFAVKSNHLLCRILQTASVPVNYDIERYMEVIYARGPYVSKYFNLTSEIDYGQFHDGVFYGPKCKEIILYNEEYFNPYEAVRNWKNVNAIEVLQHPISDLGLLLPDGTDNSTARGICVLNINLPLLLVQYRGFILDQASKFKESDAKLAVTHFVHMYVLPSILQSHIDLVILNRLKNLFYGSPMSESIGKHPFMLINYSSKIDNILEDVLKQIRSAGIYYFSSLKNIPSVFKEDIQESLLMPDLAKTRQVWWALLCTRLQDMKFLLDAGGTKGLRSNTGLLYKLQIDLKRLKGENMLLTMLPEEYKYDILADMEYILNL